MTSSAIYYRKLLLIVLLATVVIQATAQLTLYDTIPYRKEKITALTIGASATYVASMAVLNQVWYKENARETFHFFNDNREWKQVDKVGHFYSSFYISALSAKALNQCGIRPARAATTGALIAFASLLTIEIFDGYSEAYGASVGDLAANSAGALFYWLQQKQWHEQRLIPKFSFHRTSFAPQRPSLLGKGLGEEIIKDYNGQTYWLSVDMDKFIQFPKWLNIAVGYGAEAMIYANHDQNTAAGFQAYRQYYLSLDLDPSCIKTRSKVVRGLLTALSVIKLPAPTLEFTRQGAKFHSFYF
jgi:uncharacterized protein YfiM (DUF2279 family)